MTRKRTYIVAAIVVAVALVGVIVVANWGQISTFLGGGSANLDTGWISLNDGSTVSGKTYAVGQLSPDSLQIGSDVNMPATLPFAGKSARWDCGTCSDNPGDIWLELGDDFPSGDYNVELKLNYSSNPDNEPQDEPLVVKTFNAAGVRLSAAEIRDDSQQCNMNTADGWVDVSTDCSSGGGNPLNMRLATSGRMTFEGTGGSIYVGGVRITGASVNLDIPKTANPETISTQDDMNFTFTIQNKGEDQASDVIVYESIVDQNLDGQINLSQSTIGSNGQNVALSDLSECESVGGDGYCFLDLGGASGKPDTLVMYLDSLAPGSSVPIDVKLTPNYDLQGGGGFSPATYTNSVGITARELNDFGYPGNTYNIEDWNFVNRSATVRVTESVSPQTPPDLSITKTTSTPQIPTGGEAIFDVAIGNSGGIANNPFLLDSWSGNDFDNQVQTAYIKMYQDDGGVVMPGSEWVELTNPTSSYENCNGLQANPVCFVDTDGDQYGDAVLIDAGETFEQQSMANYFSLKFVLKEDAVNGSYQNEARVTASQMNSSNPNYPEDYDINNWNWEIDSAPVRVGDIQPQEADAILTKSVVNNNGSDVFVAGDRAQYTLTVTNTGNQQLNDLQIWDYYTEEDLENITVGEGSTLCSGVSSEGVLCFDGFEPLDSGQSLTVTYGGTIKEGITSQDIYNSAICRATELDDAPQGTCTASASFYVSGGLSPANEPRASLQKNVTKVGVSQDNIIRPGDAVEYTLTLSNTGNIDLTNMKIWDNYDRTSLENMSVTQGQVCDEAIYSDKLCFDMGTVTVPGGGLEELHTVKYQATVKEDVVNNTEVVNNANCESDQYPVETGGVTEACLANSNFRVSTITPPTPTPTVTPGPTPTATPFPSLTPTATPFPSLSPTATPAEQPEISVAKTVTDDDETATTSNTASAGELLTYTVSFTNSKGLASGSYLEDDYPEEWLTVVDPGGAEDSGTALLWDLGDITAGQTVSKTFKARINTSMPNNDITFENMVEAGVVNTETEVVTASAKTLVPGEPLSPVQPDPDPDPDPDPEPEPYLTLAKEFENVSGGAVQAGSLLQYTVTITNEGDADAAGIEAIDELPQTLTGLQIDSIPEGAVDESSGNSIQITNINVAAGASVQIVYTAQVVSGLEDGTEIFNGVLLEGPGGTSGEIAGQYSGDRAVKGVVGSAFTGPGTGSGQVLSMQSKAATTGGNPLVLALIAAGLAVLAGIATIYLRKQMSPVQVRK